MALLSINSKVGRQQWGVYRVFVIFTETSDQVENVGAARGEGIPEGQHLEHRFQGWLVDVRLVYHNILFGTWT